MVAIIFALIAYFGWAVGAFFETIAARKINSYSLTFLGSFDRRGYFQLLSSFRDFINIGFYIGIIAS